MTDQLQGLPEDFGILWEFDDEMAAATDLTGTSGTLHPFDRQGFADSPMAEFVHYLAMVPTNQFMAMAKIVAAQMELRNRLRATVREWLAGTPDAYASGPKLTPGSKRRLMTMLRNEFHGDLPCLKIEYYGSLYRPCPSLLSLKIAKYQVASTLLSWTDGRVEILM